MDRTAFHSVCNIKDDTANTQTQRPDPNENATKKPLVLTTTFILSSPRAKPPVSTSTSTMNSYAIKRPSYATKQPLHYQNESFPQYVQKQVKQLNPNINIAPQAVVCGYHDHHHQPSPHSPIIITWHSSSLVVGPTFFLVWWSTSFSSSIWVISTVPYFSALVMMLATEPFHHMTQHHDDMMMMIVPLPPAPSTFTQSSLPIPHSFFRTSWHWHSMTYTNALQWRPANWQDQKDVQSQQRTYALPSLSPWSLRDLDILAGTAHRFGNSTGFVFDWLIFVVLFGL